MARTQVQINPRILEWARIRAHYSQDGLAKKIPVSLEIYRKWEAGEGRPTITQLYKLVLALRRPLQTFFLDNPPEEREILREMRRLPGVTSGEESPELALQVQQTLERREIALRLYEDLGEQPPRITLRAHTEEDPEGIGSELRTGLGIGIELQQSWREPYAALRAWRSALENLGALVFQVPKVSMQEMRGFSISVDPLPIIGFNSDDSPRGRIFTLLHELGHILLRDSILHSPRDGWFQIDPSIETEQFCNNLAGAVLVPAGDLLAHAGSVGKRSNDVWVDSEIGSLSSRYQVSRAVIIRRLRKLQLVSLDSYEELRQEYDNFEPELQAAGSGGDFYATKLSHMGTLLPQLAFRTYYDNKLTTSGLSSILGLKVRHLGRLEERLFGRKYAFQRS